MAKCSFVIAAVLTFCSCFNFGSPSAQEPAPVDGETLVIPSGSLRLVGQFFRPRGPERVPAVLFHHGGGCAPSPGARVLGNRFLKQGYALLWVHRRGVGPSKGQGDCASQEITRVRTEQGEAASMDVQLKRLTTDELEDAMAGLAALRAIPGIDPGRIVVAGHSRGGQLAMLSAERDSNIRAALSFAGGAFAWDRSAAIRTRLVESVNAINVPVYLAYAEDDSAEPGRVLAAEFTRLKKPHRLVVYPTGGHGFLFIEGHPSHADAFRFLAEVLR